MSGILILPEGRPQFKPCLNVAVPERPAPSSLLYVVKQLELATRARLDALLRPTGVTALQYTALTVLARHDDLTSADLARASFVRAQSIADLVGTLERRGFIVRSADPSHGRRLIISLTDAGRAFLAVQDPRVAELEAEMLTDLDPAERADFRHYLYACRNALARAEREAQNG